MERKVGIAVVGLGGNGSDTIKAVIKTDHIKKLIGVDIHKEKCETLQKEFGIHVSTNLDDIISDQEIELFFISTNNSTHYPIGKKLLEAGKKVCMEKPMGVNLQETEDLLKTVKRTKGFLHVGFEARYFSTLYARVKEIIDSCEIGRLKHINCQYTISPFDNQDESEIWKYKISQSGGLFQEKLCHYIDLPRWWDGTRVCKYFITKSQNVIPYYEIADNFELTYQFESGVVSHLTFIMGVTGDGKNDLINTELLKHQNKEGFRLYYQIVGTEGALEANVFERQLRVFYHPGKPGLNGRSRMVRTETWEQGQDHQFFHNTTDEKIDVVKRVVNNMHPIILPEDAAETMRLCYEFEDAAQKTWKVIER